MNENDFSKANELIDELKNINFSNAKIYLVQCRCGFQYETKVKSEFLNAISKRKNIAETRCYDCNAWDITIIKKLL